MTPKQERFVEEYLVDLNGTQAAIRAGYSPATANEQASRLLANVSIADAVGRKRQEIRNESGVSQRWVLETLVRNVERCMQLHPVYDIEGNETGEYKWNPNAANNALSLIGKHLGMFNEKVDVRVMVEQLREQVRSIDDATLMALAAGSATGDPGRDSKTVPN